MRKTPRIAEILTKNLNGGEAGEGGLFYARPVPYTRLQIRRRYAYDVRGRSVAPLVVAAADDDGDDDHRCC